MKSTKKNPKLNVKLLRRIKRHILKEPKRLYMNWFHERGIPGETFIGDYNHRQTLPACGTAACIAGWAVLLSDGMESKNIYNASERAAQLLGISDYTAKWTLFHDGEWPEPFRSDYREASTQESRAKIAADRIEHLIKTGE